MKKYLQITRKTHTGGIPGQRKPGSKNTALVVPGWEKPGFDKTMRAVPGWEKPGSAKTTFEVPGQEKPGSESASLKYRAEKNRFEEERLWVTDALD